MGDGPSVLVVADDLTGANATAAGLARAGLSAVVLGAGEDLDRVRELAADYGAVVVSTDARHAPVDQAERLARAAVQAGWPAGLVGCRVDTTLRGNVSSAASAVRAAVEEESGRRAVVLCLPAHPQAGRQTVTGTQLLNGRRLEETELASDPRSPVRTSVVADVLRAQADLAVEQVHLGQVTGDPDALVEALRGALDAGAQAVVVDALTVEHLGRAARAAVEAGGDEVAWVGVDPGPGTVALAQALGLTAGAGAPLLLISGSATQATRTQLARLMSERSVHVVRPVTASRDDVLPQEEPTARALADALDEAEVGDVVVLASVLESSDVAEVGGEQADQITELLARATCRALDGREVDGLMSTGGDMTAALLLELGATGLEVHDEVVPLAVAGVLVGGALDGLPVVTKGGLVGEADAALRCLDHLRSAADTARRQVRALGGPSGERAPGTGSTSARATQA